MSRRPIGETAMTGAERIRRYRLKHGPVTKPVTKPNGLDGAALAAELERAQARIVALEADLARADQLYAGAAAEITRLKADLARKAPAESKAAPLPPSETEAERVIARLRKLLREARAETRFSRGWAQKTNLPEKGGMSFATYGKIVKALHPDSTPSEAERAEACRAFNAWTDTLKQRR